MWCGKFSYIMVPLGGWHVEMRFFQNFIVLGIHKHTPYVCNAFFNHTTYIHIMIMRSHDMYMTVSMVYITNVFSYSWWGCVVCLLWDKPVKTDDSSSEGKWLFVYHSVTIPEVTCVYILHVYVFCVIINILCFIVIITNAYA